MAKVRPYSWIWISALWTDWCGANYLTPLILIISKKRIIKPISGDSSSIPGSGRSPGEGNGNPHQYSSLENSIKETDGLQSMGSQRVDMTQQLSTHISHRFIMETNLRCVWGGV